MSDTVTKTRCAVIVGPQGAGKTALVKALVNRAGSKAPALDASTEAIDFGMTTEPNFVRFEYLGDTWNVIDCPGSTEFMQASFDAMRAADIAIVVAEPNPDRAAGVGPYFRYLDDLKIPHVLFINRIDDSETRVRDLLDTFQAYSSRPLVLRQAPIRDGSKIIGAIDLVSERAWRYREGEASALIEIPDADKERESQAREIMLDAVADFDDALMEQILEDKTPPTDEIFDVLAKELCEDMVVPVMLGSATHGNGVTRLLKLLRHEAPDVTATAARYGLEGVGGAVASIVRTTNVPHAGKISAARIWKGGLKEGDNINGGRVSGMIALNGENRTKLANADVGDLVGLARMDALSTGDLLIDGKINKSDDRVPALAPVYALAIRAKNDRDDVKLSAALGKLNDEDASLMTERRKDTNELVLLGQGDIHLRYAAAKLKNRYNIDIETATPTPSYTETIRAAAKHHARHKKQSGGHGQFADIKINVKPLGRGDGFQFDDVIHGGSVPKQFIPAVEAGIQEGLQSGPLGFPVVDLAVTLCDGQHHAVDSNEMSFKLAGRQAMREALPDCEPVLLEPIFETIIHTPNEYTNKVHSVISTRRGQILGFDAREGWPGWDSVTAMLPEAGLQDLIIELRSLSQGSATFETQFDHYQELFGRDAAKIVEKRKTANGAHS